MLSLTSVLNGNVDAYKSSVKNIQVNCFHLAKENFAHTKKPHCIDTVNLIKALLTYFS